MVVQLPHPLVCVIALVVKLSSATAFRLQRRLPVTAIDQKLTVAHVRLIFARRSEISCNHVASTNKMTPKIAKIKRVGIGRPNK